ncbi:MAG: hypothetical protein WCP34_14760 [Pseudomonadota bacterium]
MEKYISIRTETITVVHTLLISADSYEQADVRASVGPIKEVLNKEGVEILDTTTDSYSSTNTVYLPTPL